MAEKLGKKKAKTGGKESKAPQTKAHLIDAVEKPAQEIVLPGKMKICIIGPGAIGGLVAAYLKSKRRDVFVVGRVNHVRAINSGGLRVEGMGNKIFVEMRVRERLNRKVDLIILAVKTQDIREVIEENASFMENTLILTTQNGVRADSLLAKRFGEANIISSIVMFGATSLKEAEIIHNFGTDWVIGRPFGLNDERVKAVEEELASAFKISVTEDIMSMKWTKLFLNLNNCWPALLGKSMQEVFADLEMAKLAVLLLREAFAVVDGAAIKLMNLPDFEVEKFRGLVGMPPEEAAKIFSGIMVNLSKEPLYGSILQSIKRGKPSEIDYINGEIAMLSRLGNAGAVINTKVVNLVRRVEQTKKFFTIEQVVKEFNYEIFNIQVKS